MKRMRVLLAGLLGVSLVVLALATGPASATATNAKITVANQAQLLTDGSVVVTVSYTCAPGPAGDTTGFVQAVLGQGPMTGSGTAAATCDNRSHSVNLDVGPGPFSQGSGTALGIVANTDASSFASTSRGVTIK
jgi:hypothetical protein